MSKTNHMKARMSQRAISEEMVRLVMQYGEPSHDNRCILTRKAALGLVEMAEKLKRIALKATQSGGLVVVTSGNTEITTYKLFN
jgi:hypothetical protein